MTIETIILDLDGVIRHFDPEHPTRVEQRNDLTPGLLIATAFAAERIQPLITGHITRAQWTERIGEAIGNPGAAREWLGKPARIDDGVLSIVDRLRSEGYPVSILTNGTDTVPAELEQAGIRHRFDRLFNTAEIGVAKPDPAIFDHVCRALDCEPGAIFFADDSTNHVAGAERFGLVARLFRDAAGLEADLDELR